MFIFLYNVVLACLYITPLIKTIGKNEATKKSSTKRMEIFCRLITLIIKSSAGFSVCSMYDFIFIPTLLMP